MDKWILFAFSIIFAFFAEKIENQSYEISYLNEEKKKMKNVFLI